MPPAAHRRRFLLFSLFLAGMGALFFLTPLRRELTPEKLHALALSLRGAPLLPVLYAPLLALAIAAVLPAFPFVIASGLVFGPLPGMALSLLGVAGGTLLAFASGRSFLHGFVQRHIRRSPRLTRLDALTHRNGFLFTLLARLVIIVPWNLFNYAASLTSIRFRDYAAGTLIGILPEIAVMCLLGDALANLDKNPQGIILPLSLNLVILAIAWLVKRRFTPEVPHVDQ